MTAEARSLLRILTLITGWALSRLRREAELLFEIAF